MPTYQTFTIADGVAYDAYERGAFGGSFKPSIVSMTNGFNVSTTHRRTGDPGELKVFRFPDGYHGDIERHALDGTTYPTGDDASRAAYDAGLLQWMVYDTPAA